VEIGAAEDKGDRKWLEGVLAPKLAFRRASGKVVDREEFLKDVKPRGPTKTRVESVTFHGKDRAVVICIVTVQAEGRDTMYHNIRLFVRHNGGWKLLGWANEPL
jgi:hypothetical protein